ncbi:MAG: LPP20 family lipoprotein [Treponema sp.]|jgi:hypothetical protein|nr:LPP20 family lipoprotein [Treponema sp.]
MLKIAKLLIPALALLFCAGCAGAPKNRGEEAAAPKEEPAWVNNVDQVYSRLRYVAAVGYGSSRALAEKEALANVISVFGQTIQVDRQSMVGYQEALRQNAVSAYIKNTEITNAIKTSAGMETLIGAEIRDYWYDGRDLHYAVAVMEKSRAASLYSELVEANREIINNLTAMDAGERYTLPGYARYRLAAAVADGNRAFANILSVVGGPGLSPRELAAGENFRLEAENISRRIPIDIQIENDRDNRIKGAFASVIGSLGLQSGGGGSLYVLDGKISFTPVDLQKSDSVYVRYVLEANLTDRRTGAVLLPYTVSGREGHLSQAEAENRALGGVEKEIAGAWAAALTGYLDSLLSGEK